MPVITIIGIFVLTLLLNAAIAPEPRAVTYVQSPVKVDAGTPTPYTGKEQVYAIDQEANETVTILSFSLLKKGFVVVKDEKTEEILGVSRLLTPGLYSSGVIELTKPAVSGQKLIATLYADNGDGKFEMPVKGSDKEASTTGDTEGEATISFIILGEVAIPAK